MTPIAPIIPVAPDQPQFEVEIAPDDKQNVHSFACQGTLAAFTLFGRWLIIVARLRPAPIRVHSCSSVVEPPLRASVVSK